MSDFEKWFVAQDFYTNMRFIHGDKLFDKDGDVYRVLPVHIAFESWFASACTSIDHIHALQRERDQLKAQLNNMEACYIQVKKERDDLNEKEILQDHFYDQAAELKNSKLMINELQKRVDVALQVIFDCRVIGADRIYVCDAVEKTLRGEHENSN